MKTTPALELQPGMLIVEKYGVYKVTSRKDLLAQNFVEVGLADQLEPTRTRTQTLRWHEQVQTEDPYEVNIGARGKVRVELARLKGDDGRAQYRWRIVDPDSYLVEEGVDLRLGAMSRPSSKKAMEVLLGFLGAAAEAYQAGMRGQESENASLFGNPRTMEWSYLMSAEIEMAQLELGGSLGL